ncbi:FAD/NAD(P)-binding domain-containing protein [Neurospora crassa]|uniref:Monooxygenase n=1 Tax=Neurospora crassa (strain ATCC 24698 / 74-OR23-1A / CBS 708.71 / DSM 1257 / FGSC 987) TaxID=367110 RepID=Q7S5W2_NEUCR|nr:monooxygenase [Neurospora crassa OR74A]EAA30908.2 monooxygenase [Neurospora crassa OR74A]KHE86876.1 FAD/NAD(P)-binding domain-containing protein [Neurospora crassa]|eukprot:XP_960144.2 monooxygenase [Neurospora crassa OR74A]
MPFTSSYPKPPTGISILIVGAGFAGLTTAIECHRHGHSVIIYESFPTLKSLGDIISFGANGGRIFARWSDGAIAAKLRSLSIDLTQYGFRIHKYDTGEVVYHQPTPPQNPEAPVFNGHRGELHQVVFEYARDELGIEINLGRRVEGYFEDGEKAGVVLGDGERVTADIVIGADGVRSKARQLVLGFEDKPKSSGYAVWRAWYVAFSQPLSHHTLAKRSRFPNTDMIVDPRTSEFCSNGDTFNGWIGPDVHFLFSTIKNGSDCCWVLTHRDEHDIDESWSFPGKLEDVYKVLEGWDPICKAIVEKTPSLVDWKLVYRDPLPTWVSKHARILLVGDSAHPFLPTSAQGATQAMEDGVTIAVCLRRAGKEGVQAAVRTYQEIRYDRVRAVQKTGETTRDRWHKTDWEKVAKDPTSIAFPREDWIHQHDAEKHAEEVFDEIFKRFIGPEEDKNEPLLPREESVAVA